jgi:hypothetical protein
MSDHTEETPRPSAIILRFPRKRGRPKSIPRGTDYGTPELSLKRLRGETAETLDLCLERALITREQHWCGIHLRWLYTLRHGAPSVRAIDPTHLGGIEPKPEDPEWRGAREKEYHEAIKKLADKGNVPLLMNLCVYNERPKFLNLRQPAPGKRLTETETMLRDLRAGLDILAKLWGKTPRSKK